MIDSGQPLVSVVTPFFNTEEHLAECIESVLAQSYRHFEYILANNCSTDRSVEIAEHYAARDARIRLIHNERFLPQLPNYNQALRRISPNSRYVKVVQADDAIFPRCLEEMVAVAEANPTVGVVASYRLVGKGIGPLGLPRNKSVMSGREAIRLHLIEDMYLFGTQTAVLVRSDIVRARDPFYAEDSCFADVEVVYDILAEHDFAFVHQLLSFTRIEHDSAAGRLRSYNPLILERYIRLKLVGSRYLSPEEYARYFGEHLRLYRRFLAEAWLRRREEGFWEFHRKGLARIGEEIDRSRFPIDAVPVVVHFALRPLLVAEWFLRRARRFLDRDPDRRRSSRAALAAGSGGRAGVGQSVPERIGGDGRPVT